MPTHRFRSSLDMLLGASLFVAFATVLPAVTPASSVAHAARPAPRTNGLAIMHTYADATVVYGDDVNVLVTMLDDSNSCNSVGDCDPPTGNVVLYDNDDVVADGPIGGPSGAASSSVNFYLHNLPVGTHHFTAAYTGDFDITFDDVGATTTVTKATCSVTLSVSPTHQPAGSSSPAVFTAVMDHAGYSGNVDFFWGATFMGTSAIYGGSVAAIGVPVYWRSPGTIVLHAVFNGDANHVPCTSNESTYTIDEPNRASGEVLVPAPVNDGYTTAAGTPVTGEILANDGLGNGPPLTVVITVPPAHGTAVINDDFTVTYTPDDGFFGNDVFTYKLTDSSQTSNSAQVFITVQAPPAPSTDSSSTTSTTTTPTTTTTTTPTTTAGAGESDSSSTTTGVTTTTTTSTTIVATSPSALTSTTSAVASAGPSGSTSGGADAPTPQLTSATLPTTGGSSWAIGVDAALLVAFGVLCIAVARRRPAAR